MSKAVNHAILGVLLALSLLAAPAGALTDEEVEAKISELKALLYARQDPALGGWFDDQYHPHPAKDPAQQNPESNKNLGGPTALATLALLVSGESSQEPRLAKGLDYLRSLDMYGTYALSLKVHVWSYLPDQYLDLLERDGQMLLGGADPQRSTWRYICYPERSKGWDNSTNQYGILGMWQYAKRGGRLRTTFWENAAKHFLETQRPEGGWAYSPNREITNTMTSAGLTCLYVVQQELFRGENRPPDQIAKAIERGLENLDETFNPRGGGHGGAGYGRYGYERVALASGIKYFKGQDWFESVAEHILRENHAGDRTVVNTSFDLMFLSRGRVPVWANKIELANGNWNNRPNDIYFLSRFLSKAGEHEVNWQVVSFDKPVMDYINAPVAWLSSDSAVELTDAEKAGLKQYIELGGMLVANSENSPGFEQSIVALGEEMFPDAKWSVLDDTHPVSGVFLEATQRGKLPIRALSNGARDLIILSQRDWGLALQKEPELARSTAGQYMTNIYAIATNRANLPNRLVKPFPAKTGSGGGEVWLAAATFGPEQDHGNIEPGAYTALGNVLANEARVSLKWAEAPLEDVGDGTMSVDGQERDIDLLHLTGTDTVALTDAQKQAIKSFVDEGGTVFVETVGGRGEFAVDVEQQLMSTFGAGASSIGRAEKIISGQGLDGGESVARAVYRRFSVINMASGTRNRLRAISVDGRPAVIFSAEDVSLGVLGVHHWGINGYQDESARQIMTNIIMSTQ